VIPGIEDILHMLLSGQIDQQQAKAWIERHIETAAETDGLRDSFAAAALPGALIARADADGDFNPAAVASAAYIAADAMLLARASA
jgi:hypothetical protein